VCESRTGDIVVESIIKRVEFGDTDMAGIVHFSNFFRYMESAETSFLLSRGLNVSWLDGETRLGFPRVSATCDYHSPARFGDEIQITVSIEKIGTKSVQYRFEFTRNSTSIATGKITAVFCQSTPDHHIQPTPIPDGIRQKLLQEAG
jgi:acyl-CoA thioester hydrolase